MGRLLRGKSPLPTLPHRGGGVANDLQAHDGMKAAIQPSPIVGEGREGAAAT